MSIDLEQAASTLVRDHADRRNIKPFARAWGAADLAGAYAIQAAFVQRLVPTYGPGVGYKIGLTSARMQQMCSVDHPIAGVVLQRRVYPSGARLPLRSLVRLGLEFEICVRLGRDLPPRGRTYEMDEVAQAVDAVAPAFEVIDDRNSAYPLDMLSLVADNAWNEGIVLGGWQTAWPDLAAARGLVECDGRIIDQGHGRDVLGHPFEPLRWLANHLQAQGVSLKSGEIVSTGSLVTTRFPASREQYRFTVEGIGSVEITLEA